MIITNSPEIGNLEVLVQFDITGINPVINLTNQTTGNTNTSPIPDLSQLIWVLNIYSPTGTPIFQSDFDDPWKPVGDGDWTTEQITDAWPRPFGQIEWSDYQVEFQVKDTEGNIYDLNKSGNICRPSGSNKKYADLFGHVKMDVEVMCDRSSLYFRDSTSKLYQGKEGVNQSSFLVVDYPRDGSGALPDPYELSNFVVDALVPFYQNGEHNATYYSIWRYDLGDNVYIDIRYVAQEAFPIQCNIDLCPIACEVQYLEESITSGQCANIAEAQSKLNLITPKLLRAFIAKVNPTCGVDLPALIEEIKQIGGFSCDCNATSSGIGTAGISMPPFLFTVNNQGGDVMAQFRVIDGNVVLDIKDKSYTFGSCEPAETTAIKLVTSTSGTNTNVCLKTDLASLAQDLYSITAANAYLLNLFNSLVIGGGGGFNLVVDGKCVINSGACNYEFLMSGIPANTTNAILSGIISSVPDNNRSALNYAFNGTTLTQLQTYLNTLGIGVFVVTDMGAGNIKIASSSNISSLTGLLYNTSIVTAKKLAVFTSDCTGFAELSANDIIQAIIDYLCALTDTEITTSEAYTICYIDPVTLTKKTETVDASSKLNVLLSALMARGCNTIDFILQLKSVNCGILQGLFATSTNLMGANDFFMGTKQGNCAKVYPVEAGRRILQLGAYDPGFVNDFCTLVQMCGAGKVCTPYNVLEVSTVLDSPSSNKMAIVVTFDHAEASKASIRYARIDQGGELIWSVPIEVLPGQSPYSIPNLDEGQYIVGVTPVYADGRKCAEVTKTTGSCGSITSFSAIFNGSNIVASFVATSEKVRITVIYPNGGQFTQIYATGASPVNITPPADVSGTYQAYIQPVCNETTEWYGSASAPVVIDVQPDNNSDVTNNASFTLAAVTLSAQNESGSSTLLNPTTLNPTVVANFYIPDGFYTSINIVSLSGVYGWTAYLVTDSGTYTVNGDGFFENVTVENGIHITILDTSP